MVGAGVGGVRLGGYGGKIAVIASAEGQGHIDETLLCHAVGIVVSVLRAVGLDFGNAVGHKEIFSIVVFLVKSKGIFSARSLGCGNGGKCLALNRAVIGIDEFIEAAGYGVGCLFGNYRYRAEGLGGCKTHAHAALCVDCVISAYIVVGIKILFCRCIVALFEIKRSIKPVCIVDIVAVSGVGHSEGQGLCTRRDIAGNRFNLVCVEGTGLGKHLIAGKHLIGNASAGVIVKQSKVVKSHKGTEIFDLCSDGLEIENHIGVIVIFLGFAGFNAEAVVGLVDLRADRKLGASGGYRSALCHKLAGLILKVEIDHANFVFFDYFNFGGVIGL